MGLGQADARPSNSPMREVELTARALTRYRAMAAQDDGEPLPITGAPVQPGERYDGVPRLVRLLSLIGDLPSYEAPENGDLYAGAVVEAVQRFQLRHGLAPSGVINEPTLDALNVPLTARVRQLELALERWRRRPWDPDRPAIVLNLPEFRLRAYDAGANLALNMKAVVGQPPDHKSPILRSQLAEVIFRPYWNVPIRIQRDELVPEIERDPKWIASNNFEVVTPDGEMVDPNSEDLVSELTSGRVQLRQKPGPGNTLGMVKFLFPNAYGIYMHDTSARALFQKERRDLSHGCIRVEKPVALAEWVLRDQGWSPEQVDAAIHGDDTISVKVRRPIQVVTMYVTAMVTESGEVHFFKDIYDEDQVLTDQLAERRRPTP